MPRRSVYIGIGLISAAVLLFQLTLTRIFSATLYYHFAFMAISIALFGSGAGGVAVYVTRRWLGRRETEFLLAILGLLFSASTIAAQLVHLRSTFSLQPGAENYGTLLLIYVAAAVPLFFAGALIALAVSRYAEDIGVLYLFDLFGAAAGCLLLIPLLNRFGGVNTILVVAVLAASSAMVFAFNGKRRSVRYATSIVAVLALGIFIVNAATNAVDIRQFKSTRESNPLFVKWNSLSRISVTGKLSDPTLYLAIDAGASTYIFRDAGIREKWPSFDGDVSAIAYYLRPGGETLIIGPGGGTDVVNARTSRQRKITAVELNPIIARDVMSSEPFRSYSAGLFQQPDVDLVVDEGRSFIRTSDQQYDVIQASMVDTWAATAAGAFALAENNIYTVEAFADYWNHLRPNGILSMTRWYFEPPDQMARLASLARTMMDREGVAEPANHVIVVKNRGGPGARVPATFLLKKGAFSAEEIAMVERVAARDGFDLLYTPARRPRNIFTAILVAEDPDTIWSVWPTNIAPTFDNNPFFFNTLRPSQLGLLVNAPSEWRHTNLGTVVLFWLIGISAVMVLLFILGPLALAQGQAIAGDTPRKLAALSYFVCLGAGFILVEVTLTQKFVLFLGHPVYALVVVLFSLLLFSGLGSALSVRVSKHDLRAAIGWMAFTVAALILAIIFLASPLFNRLVHLPIAARIAITVLFIGPMGIMMGMPMPTGVRLLHQERPEMIPWAWGVNGAASVMGSVLALAIAILTGFNQSLALGAALYLLAVMMIQRSRPNQQLVDE